MKTTSLLALGAVFATLLSCSKGGDGTPPDTSVKVTGVTISPADALIAQRGDNIQFSASVQPAAADQGVMWSVSPQDWGQIDATGKVTIAGIAEVGGTVTVTAISTADMTKKATKGIAVISWATYDPGVSISGTTWATRNVDAAGTFATAPESRGMFYQWNRLSGWPATGSVTGWVSTSDTSTEWTAANDPCPGGWRVPTNAQFESLIASGSVWTAVNSVNGRRFGSGANTVFLPIAGLRDRDDGALDYQSIYGRYWSSTHFVDTYLRTNSDYLSFDDDDAHTMTFQANNTYGLSVRCVKE